MEYKENNVITTIKSIKDKVEELLKRRMVHTRSILNMVELKNQVLLHMI